MDTESLDRIIARCAEDGASYEELARAVGDAPPEEFCDAFARRVAHLYAAGQISFIEADGAMNILFAYGFSMLEHGLPRYANDVFLAFDDGEYRHVGDTEETDPEAKYTRSQIAEIISRETRG